MKTFRNTGTGALVSVRDDKVLGSEWQASEAEADRSESPDPSWKVADLKAYASDNDIDLGDATKKDDILAAISSSGE